VRIVAVLGDSAGVEIMAADAVEAAARASAGREQIIPSRRTRVSSRYVYFRYPCK